MSQKDSSNDHLFFTQRPKCFESGLLEEEFLMAPINMSLQRQDLAGFQSLWGPQVVEIKRKELQIFCLFSHGYIRTLSLAMVIENGDHRRFQLVHGHDNTTANPDVSGPLF